MLGIAKYEVWRISERDGTYKLVIVRQCRVMGVIYNASELP